MNNDPQAMDTDELKLELDREMAEISPDELERLAAARPTHPPRPDERGRVRGTILDIRGDTVYIDMGGKSEAFLPLSEFASDDVPTRGQVFDFVMHGIDAESGLMRLSLREVRLETDLEALRVGDVVEARVTGVNIGGLELNSRGLRAFMPKSQVDLSRVDDFAPYIGRVLECEITEVNRKGRSLVVSRRRVLERKRAQASEELRYSLAEGQVRQGVVRRLADFGAFVDLGGVEGLLHISDICYGRLKHPSEVLKEGDEVSVQVRKIDLVKNRISLGMKQLQADPWTVVPANYRVGETYEVRVVTLQNFGAFVQLEPGVEGLIPISEMSHVQRIRHPKELVAEGDSVRCTLIDLDLEKRKLTFSLKALSRDPWADAVERYKPDEIVTGRVTNLMEYGAFVQLEEGIEGLVHISEMSHKRIRKPDEACQVGDTVQVRVKSLDPQQRRISLSMKTVAEPAAPHPEPTRGPAADAAPPPSAHPRTKRKKPLKGGLEY